MLQRPTPVVLNLLIINALVFVALNLLSQERLVPIFVLFKSDALLFRPEGTMPELFAPWQLLTCFFAHEGFFHFLFNMFALYSIGTQVEMVMGSRKFLGFYLFCGIGASLALAFLDPSPNPVLGASTAISGVLVALAFYFPESRMMIFPLPVPIQARYLVAGLFVLSPCGDGGGTSLFLHANAPRSAGAIK
jgi:membrane associated rhomboid family serine protease